MTTLTALDTDPDSNPDPIDQLIPPRRPWWVRLTVGLGVLLVVGVCSALVGFGYVYPRPDCCGSGSGSALMTLTPDGQAVVVQAYVFNSSGRDLNVLWATAELPGAQVLDVALVNNADPVLPVQTQTWPATLPRTQPARIAITFVPDTCRTDVQQWGQVQLRLDVVNRFLPSIDRTYTLPDAVLDRETNQLSVFAPDNDPRWSQLQDPLEAACALLGRR